ncbi:MAG: endonuclease III domain-containing protein [Bacillota bacterium]
MARLTSKKVIEILDLLKAEYPDAGCALVHVNVYELIVCVVLSAQTTDASVNRVSPALFAAYPDAESLAKASQKDVEEIIRTIGMYRTKAKNIIALARALCEKHGGQVPDDYDALTALPGVGRKTANVVLAVGFGHQKIAVDTHVFRVSHRIGLATEASSGTDKSSPSGKGKGSPSGDVKLSAKNAGEKNVLATEKELMKILPEDRWSEAHHSLIWHGRNCCTARNPACGRCPIEKLCRKAGL